MKRFVAITAALWMVFGAVAGAQPYSASEGPLDLGADTIAAGETVSVAGEGFTAGSEVEIVLTTTGETVLGSATVGDDGSFSVDVTVPDDFGGDGVLFARGTGADGATRVLGVRVTGGSVGELALTGASSRTGTLVTVAIGLVLAGSVTLVVGRRLRTA